MAELRVIRKWQERGEGTWKAILALFNGKTGAAIGSLRAWIQAWRRTEAKRRVSSKWLAVTIAVAFAACLGSAIMPNPPAIQRALQQRSLHALTDARAQPHGEAWRIRAWAASAVVIYGLGIRLMTRDEERLL